MRCEVGTGWVQGFAKSWSSWAASGLHGICADSDAGLFVQKRRIQSISVTSDAIIRPAPCRDGRDHRCTTSRGGGERWRASLCASQSALCSMHGGCMHAL
jgi:hypothetical protein